MYSVEKNVQNEENSNKAMTILWKCIMSQCHGDNNGHRYPHFFGRIPKSTYQDMTRTFLALRFKFKTAK